MKHWDKWTKKELLSLKQRYWDKTSEYSSVLLVNSRMKHDSGYNLFAIIGVDDDGVPVEIAGYMDDFRLDRVKGTDVLTDIRLKPYHIGIDCSMHGVFRIHSYRYSIEVGPSLSTTCFNFKELENDLERINGANEMLKDYSEYESLEKTMEEK